MPASPVTSASAGSPDTAPAHSSPSLVSSAPRPTSRSRPPVPLPVAGRAVERGFSARRIDTYTAWVAGDGSLPSCSDMASCNCR